MGPLAVFFIVWFGLTFFLAFMTTCTPVARNIAKQTPPIDMTGFQIDVLSGRVSIGQRIYALVIAFAFGLKLPITLAVAGISSVVWAIVS